MTYDEFLNAVIERGIDGATHSYSKSRLKLDGAIAGFNACRSKSPEALLKLLEEARANTQRAIAEELPDYWKHRCFELEIGWVCNCVSVLLVQSGHAPLEPFWPTVRAAINVAAIVGVSVPVERQNL